MKLQGKRTVVAQAEADVWLKWDILSVSLGISKSILFKLLVEDLWEKKRDMIVDKVNQLRVNKKATDTLNKAVSKDKPRKNKRSVIFDEPLDID